MLLILCAKEKIRRGAADAVMMLGGDWRGTLLAALAEALWYKSKLLALLPPMLPLPLLLLLLLLLMLMLLMLMESWRRSQVREESSSQGLDGCIGDDDDDEDEDDDEDDDDDDDWPWCG
jgi:membrane protein implicated in regulation of membrane protease activity